ncbi:tryptophanyl-tRNA synthetase, partial [candidate division MSBL1 archaeon SCGC-AAA382C18]
SSSNPKSAIFLTDTAEEVEEKVMNAVTGGRNTVEEQKEKGGKPDECMIYTLYLYHLLPEEEDLKEAREDCVSGDILCGACKEKALNLLDEFLETHRDNREEAKETVEELVEEKLD